MAKRSKIESGQTLTVNERTYPIEQVIERLEMDDAAELFGYALEERGGKFLACRISTLGAREYIGPKMANGEVRPESMPAALGRMYEAMRKAYSPARNMRFG